MPADFWWQMSYVALLSTALATLLQNLAQRHVEPSKAALLFSLESVFGTSCWNSPHLSSLLLH